MRPNPAPGERHGMHKLTEAQVREIRRRHVWRCKVNGVKALAREYGLRSHETVRLIVRGETWKHVG